MCLNTEEAWKSDKILYGGETSRYKNLTIMRMRLPDGSNATTDAENSTVLAPHFAKVFCANRPIDWSELEEAIQIDVMQEIDQPVSWDKLKAAVTKLTNNKAPYQIRNHQTPLKRSTITT